jgi:hypothetical protein
MNFRCSFFQGTRKYIDEDAILYFAVPFFKRQENIAEDAFLLFLSSRDKKIYSFRCFNAVPLSSGVKKVFSWRCFYGVPSS